MIVIDGHHHWMPRAHIEQLDRYVGPGEEVFRDGGIARVRRDGIELFTLNEEYYSSVEAQLKDMDAVGIDMAVLSTGLWQWWNNMDLAPTVNDGMAEIQQRYPDRFIGLAHVPPFDPAAPAELERAVKSLGLRGLCLSTHCQGKYIDDPAYLPIYRKASELGLTIFVHASPTPLEYSSLRVYDAARLLGRVFDQTIAVTRLAYCDILDQLPGLRFVIGHLGGALFILKERLTGLAGAARTPKADFASRFARIYADSAPPYYSTIQMQCAVQTLGSSQVLFGTDYPVQRHNMQSDKAIMDSVPIADEQRQQIMGQNVAKLLGINDSFF